MSALSINDRGCLVILSNGFHLHVIAVVPMQVYSSDGTIKTVYGFVTQLEREMQ